MVQLYPFTQLAVVPIAQLICGTVQPILLPPLLHHFISIFHFGSRVRDHDDRVVKYFEEILDSTFPKFDRSYFPYGLPENVCQVSLQN